VAGAEALNPSCSSRSLAVLAGAGLRFARAGIPGVLVVGGLVLGMCESTACRRRSFIWHFFPFFWIFWLFFFFFWTWVLSNLPRADVARRRLVPDSALRAAAQTRCDRRAGGVGIVDRSPCSRVGRPQSRHWVRGSRWVATVSCSARCSGPTTSVSATEGGHRRLGETTQIGRSYDGRGGLVKRRHRPDGVQIARSAVRAASMSEFGVSPVRA